MKLDVFNSIYDGYSQNLSSSEVAKLLRKSQSFVSSVFAYFKFADYDTVKSIVIDKQYKRYAVEDIIDIAEEMVTKHIRLHHGVIKFAFEFNRLNTITKLRKDKGSKLCIEDLKDITWIGTLDYNKEQEKQALPKNVQKTPHGLKYSTNDMQANELKQMADKPRIFGKANAIPRAFVKPKKMRNKQVVEANKQQERIEQNIAKAKENLDKNVSLCKEKDTQQSVFTHKSRVFKGHPASKFLDANGNYIQNMGRTPYIDPDSDGFDKVPKNVQFYSLKRRLEDLSVENDALKKFQALVK